MKRSKCNKNNLMKIILNVIIMIINIQSSWPFNTLIQNKVNPFSTNVPFTDKPVSWFLLAKCLKNTCARVTF